jgi:flavorubredoxin
MEQFARELVHIKLKKRFVGIFGSYSWNGGGVKSLKEFIDETDLELVSEPVDIYGKPNLEKLAKCDEMAKNMALKLKE